MLGQLVLVVHPQLGPELLMLVAMCFALCTVPVAMTRAIHPAPLHPAPLEPRFFMKRVPQSLTAVLGAGLIIGSFYGLAPVYAAEQGLSTEQVGLFMGCCILAGFLVQWPLGLLSDRYDRSVLMRIFAAATVVASLPLAVFPSVPVEVLFGVGFLASLMQFCLYPLAVAFANDHVEAERRVSLTAMLLMTYGIGASIGPLAAGVVMKLFGGHMLYAFVCGAGVILVLLIRPKAVTHLHQSKTHRCTTLQCRTVCPARRWWLHLTRVSTSRWFRNRCRRPLSQSRIPRWCLKRRSRRKARLWLRPRRLPERKPPKPLKPLSMNASVKARPEGLRDSSAAHDCGFNAAIVGDFQLSVRSRRLCRSVVLRAVTDRRNVRPDAAPAHSYCGSARRQR